MKIISYADAEGDCIVIEKAQDLYPLLDWFHSRLLDLESPEEQISEVSKIMEIAEEKGLGSFEDVETIEYL